MKPSLFRLRQLIYPQKFLWILAWLFGVITVVSSLGLVMVAGWFVSMTAMAGVLGVLFLYALPSLWIRIFAVCRTLARYGDLMVSHFAVFTLLRDLRVRFFRQWASLPIISRMTNTQTSSQTMHRLVKDIDTLNEFTLRLISPLVVASVSVFLMVGLILFFIPKALLSALFLLLALALAFLALGMGVRLADDENLLNQNRKSHLLDTLPALTSLLVFGRWQDTVNQITTVDKKHYQLTQKIYRLKRNAGFLIQLCIMASVLCLLIGVHGLFDGQMTIYQENIQAYFSDDNFYQVNHITPALVLALVFGVFGLIEIVLFLVAEPLALGRSLVAKARLNHLISLPDTKQSVMTQSDIAGDMTLTLQNIFVKQSGSVFGIEGLNAVFNTHQPNLIMGASGSGKSTLLALLAGEILPQSGQILLDDVDYFKIDFQQSLGFLGQTVDIFDQTLADNLRLGKADATEEELLFALEQVDLLDWVKTQPNGLDTALGEYGMAVSGGQARRIALARLLLNSKKILLLDEPFAGLDEKTCQKVWQNLLNKQQNQEIGILIIATHQYHDFMQQASVLNIHAK